jgi:hypothetical protein
MRTFPLEIFYLVIEQISAADYPLSYTRDDTDTKSLLAMCLASRDLNAIATRHLYATITVSSQRVLRKLANTVEVRPHILASCQHLVFRFLNHMDDRKIPTIIAAAVGLRSLSLLVGRRYPKGFLEVASPYQLFHEIPQHDRFDRLQRLVASNIFFQRKEYIDCLLNLPNLTHLALAHFRPKVTYIAGFEFYLAHKCSSTKVIVALPHMHRVYLDRIPATENFVILEYGSGRIDRPTSRWFVDRVIDGTIWDMRE